MSSDSNTDYSSEREDDTLEARVQQRLAFCRSLPKVELHAHLNGSIRHQTLRELAMAADATLDLDTDEVLKLTRRGDRTLSECFKLFDLIHRVTTKHDVITRITREVLHDFHVDGVVYVELRTTPKNNAGAGMTKRSYAEACLRGMDEYLQHSSRDAKPPTIGRLLLSIDRREGSEEAMATVRLAAALRDEGYGVVGVDLSGNPTVGQWDTWAPALLMARQLRLKVTLHCGEVLDIRESAAMLKFHPDRLGHCCTLDPRQVAQVAEARIPVELCLTSNLKTESVPTLDEHHWVPFTAAGVRVALCTDDSGVFNTSLSREFALAGETFHLTDRQLFMLAREASLHIFDPSPEVHAMLRNTFDEFVVRRHGSLARRAAAIVGTLVKCACTLLMNVAWLVTHALCMLLPTSASLLHSFFMGSDRARRRHAHWD